MDGFRKAADQLLAAAPRNLAGLADKGIPTDPMRTSYFIGRNTFFGAAPAAAAALAAEAVPRPVAHRRQRARQPHRDLAVIAAAGATHMRLRGNCISRRRKPTPRKIAKSPPKRT
jgi:hypothetical protein